MIVLILSIAIGGGAAFALVLLAPLFLEVFAPGSNAGAQILALVVFGPLAVVAASVIIAATGVGWASFLVLAGASASGVSKNHGHP